MKPKQQSCAEDRAWHKRTNARDSILIGGIA
jgi:hypothetical protein